MSPREKSSTSGRKALHEGVQADYRLAWRSRQTSLLGRREVFSGKAKFGIFGDGKEVAQVALARAFRKGDWRSGYYRDQTLMLALGLLSVEEFFAQLYAHADLAAEPASAGRQMTAHFATRFLDAQGGWRDLTAGFNSSADVSPTGSQMPRLVGLGQASRLFRELDELASMTRFSDRGGEVAFGTIGNASCAEGLFWESINAIGVLGAPVVLSIWDDGYGISVPNEYQVTFGDLSRLLAGFQRRVGERGGFDLHTVRGWDYPALCETYVQAAETARNDRIPSILHVIEMTQPQGHSTSGSHERYKSKERLEWEEAFDCLRKMRAWILAERLVSEKELDAIEEEEAAQVQQAKERAWQAYLAPILAEREELAARLAALSPTGADERIPKLREELARLPQPFRRDLVRIASEAIYATRGESGDERARLIDWRRAQQCAGSERYASDLHADGDGSALNVPEIAPIYASDAPNVRGFEILNAAFDAALARHPELVAFGEDLGKLGDVNQGFSGLQEKYGELRVGDTGIREATLVGQAIGMAMRGIRPIVEIQYLDYVLYALQILSDDLATVRYRSKGGQKAPVIVRTRGHRLEGIWHSGSPMAGVINLVRGIWVCVPRDMTRAAGMYNTLLRGDDPALVVEVLNGYRTREAMPSNLAEFTVPLGMPEVIRDGADLTLVTYGACCRIAIEAADLLAQYGADIEVIDVQTLLPFDRPGRIVESLRKTARVLFLDEDVPGGATAYMMQRTLDTGDGWRWLDSPPRCLAAQPHRPAYGSDGDYWSKPNREQVFEVVYEMLREADPGRFGAL